MLDLNLNAVLIIILYSVLAIIVGILIYSREKIRNVHVVMLFILFLVLILKNSIVQN